MKHAKLLYATLPALVSLSLLTGSLAEARGFLGGFGGMGMMAMRGNKTPDDIVNMHTSMFQHHADLLGLSLDKVKDAWAQGKTLPELAKEHNITQEQLNARMKEAHTKALQTQLQALVSKGIITQAQADARLKTMQAKAPQDHMKGMRKALRHGWGW